MFATNLLSSFLPESYGMIVPNNSKITKQCKTNRGWQVTANAIYTQEMPNKTLQLNKCTNYNQDSDIVVQQLFA